MINRYPLWKNCLLAFLLILGFIYAAPILYVPEPAVQISGQGSVKATQKTLSQIETVLKADNVHYKSAVEESSNLLLIRFPDTDNQLKAKEIIKTTLGDNYNVALNLVSAIPHWLTALGATPMKLGLDLRGGVHFLLNVDVKAVAAQRIAGSVRTISTALREENIRYVDIQREKNGGVLIQLRDEQALNAAYKAVHKQLPELKLTKQIQNGNYFLQGEMTDAAMNEIRQYAIEQSMTTLRNRVNELGISEAIVQQQGADRIAIDLPGIQDTARAKEIIGGTAQVEFHLVDQDHDPRNVLAGGITPSGSKMYTYEGQPILLKDQVILTGNSITDASAGYGEDGRAAVNVRLGGGGEAYFGRVTRDNIGKLLAVVFLETKIENKIVNGKPEQTTKKVERVIQVATIQAALIGRFQITGMADPNEAKNIALLLRAGALPAPIYYIEERLVGPSLGKENIRMGVLSIEIGFAIVVLFMAFYYRVFGLIADIALAMNLILLVALLSILGMTLTLPGMAGIVLTVGMAVDANVLIFERIREELRNGASPQASIHAGYARALSTIIDANVTSLIVAIVLFGIGTGAVKGFAVTVSIGILTSMITGIMFTRAMVNLIYGGRNVERLHIGI